MARKRQRIERSPPAAATARTTTGDPSSDTDTIAREVTPDPLDQYDATTPPDKMISDIRNEIMLYRRDVEKNQQFPECVILSSFFGSLASGVSLRPTDELDICNVFRTYTDFCERVRDRCECDESPTVQLSSDECDRLLDTFFNVAIRILSEKSRARMCQRLLDYYVFGN